MYASSADLDLDVTDDGENSLYNGDENHKIWTGSQDQLNGINGHQNGGESHYDFYSNGTNGGTSTLGRPSRQRQISAPIPVPPPPKEELKKKKEIKKSSKSVGSQSLSGTLIRPRPIHPAGRGPPPHMMIYGPPHMHGHHPPPQHHMMGPPMGPPQMNGRQFHTIGHRGHPQPPPQMIQMHHMQPMPMILPPQYATLQSVKGKKKKGKDKMNGGIPVGLPMPPMFYPPPSSLVGESPRAMHMSNRKLAQSTAALDDSGNSGAESPGGTGIYRRKGHLNERAFSYSIRQEHRSRSHGSLASLQFNPPDMKEREIIQMVSGLEIKEDSTLRRSREMSAGSSGTFGKPRR